MGGGTRTRFRHVTQMAKQDGKPCDAGEMSRTRSLQFYDSKPDDESDVLVTGILYDIEQNFEAVAGSFSFDHLVLTFISGMLIAVLVLGVTARVLRRNRSNAVVEAEGYAME